MNDEHLKDKIVGLRLVCDATIEANKDTRIKNVGDRVMVWDGSANRDKNTRQQRHGIDPLFKTTAVVAEIGLEESGIYEVLNIPFFMDLLIVFDSGEEVYCASDMVRIIDNAES